MVELEAEGDDAAVDALIAAVRRGPAGARVENVHVEVIPLTEGSGGFRIAY
jgi:acylphosphatase